MAFQSFENLDVWRRGCELAVLVYRSTNGSRDFGLRDQMRRAAVSIPSNIAEGYERTGKDVARFLSIAKDSAAELRTQALIAEKVGVLSQADADHIAEETRQ